MATAIAPLPSRKAEDWRYSDTDALSAVWPVAPAEHIAVGTGETVARQLVQDAADGEVAVHDYVIDIAAGGSLTFHLLNIGGKLGRVTFDVTVHAGALFDLKAAIIGAGDQTLEIITNVHHVEPDAISRQTIRSVLAGHSTGNYLGRVAVARGADGTDGSQSVKAMLVDRTATANARPELEIFADDVKCAHGASVGELDKAAMFYCAARGIDPVTTRTLLLQAFIAGLFDDVADDATREAFDSAALAKLGALT